MKVRKYDIVIGIDPDIQESGYASYHNKDKRFTVGNMPFPALLDTLKVGKKIADQNGLTMLVCIEASWLERKSNHHGSKNIHTASKIGKNVGANHQTGRLIQEMCLHYGIEVQLVKPFRLVWKNGKISAAEFKKHTGYSKRCNQDARDAGLIAWEMKDTVYTLVKEK